MWTSYLHELSPEEMVRQFAEKGWTHLELSTEHGLALLQTGDPEATGRAFREFAGDHGVALPQGHLWLKCDIAAIDQARELEALLPWLDLYLGLGIQAAVLHPGGKERRTRGDGPASIHEAQVHALEHVAGRVRGSDVCICLENLAVRADAAHLLDLIHEAGGRNLGICLDTGHLHMAGGHPADFVREAGLHLKALHIADNEGSVDQHLMPFGRGTVDWSGFVQELGEIPYQGLFNFEIPGENRCPMPVRLAKLDYIRVVAQMMLDGAS